MGDRGQSSSGDNVITISLFHGGTLKWLPKTKYVGGTVSLYHIQDESLLNFEFMMAKTKALGYKGFQSLYYRMPMLDMEHGLVLMKGESDVVCMREFAKGHGYKIDVYVKHIGEDYMGAYEDAMTTENRDSEDGSNEVGDMSDELDDYEFQESEYEMSSDDDMQFNNNVDEGVEWVGKLREELGLMHEWEEDKDSGSEKDYNPSDSDDLDSLADLDEEIQFDKGKKVFPAYKDSDSPKWEVGMIFTDHHQCREAIMKHSHSEGRCIKFVKSDKTRVRARCKEPCPWWVYASLNFDKCIQIKKVGPDHTCVREQKLPLINSGFLARKYLAEFRINPTWPIPAFHKTVLKDLQLDIKTYTLRRAKRLCMKIINGTHEEQYEKLWDYKTELLRRNPNSTVEIECEPGNEGVFKRMYICLGGVKHGFKLGCRKVIGLDGCHIKTAYKGQLLSAVEIDPNNCMYPIAYAVVEAERLDSWRWFLALVAEDFELGLGDGWTLISDRQKGLLNVVDEMLPMAEHRYCVRHMHNNFKQNFPGRSLKDKLWACARASNVEAFENAMRIVKEEDEGAWQWLTQIPFHHWARSHFKTDTKCDMLLNNMCETFNKCIMWAREQGILVLLEMIREYLMRRLQFKRETVSDWESKNLTPKAYKLLDKYKKWSGGCYSTYAGYDEFEVTTVNGSKYAVHLGNRSCGCKRWDLSGIPCHHAISSLNRLGYNMEDYVDTAYWTYNYKNAYSGIVYPMNGHLSWERSGVTLRPPTIENQPGRPKKRRRHEKKEVVVKSDGVQSLSKSTQGTVRCGQCKKSGHNKRTCPELINANEVDHIEEPFNEADEEQMQEAYHEILQHLHEDGPHITQPTQEVMDEDGPPLTQPTQATVMAEERDDAPEAAESEQECDIAEDCPLMVAVETLKKMKQRLQKEKAAVVTAPNANDTVDEDNSDKSEAYEVPMEEDESEAERMEIKKEMQQRIDDGNKKKRGLVEEPVEVRRSHRLRSKFVSKFTNTADNPIDIEAQGVEKHNTYTGPMKLGKKAPPPIKQYKTIVGSTTLKSAPFLSHGRHVITATGLTTTLQMTSKHLKNANKGKDKGKGKKDDAVDD